MSNATQAKRYNFDEPVFRFELPPGEKDKPGAPDILYTFFNPNGQQGGLMMEKHEGDQVSNVVVYFDLPTMEAIAYIFGCMATNCRKAANGDSADSQIRPLATPEVQARFPMVTLISE